MPLNIDINQILLHFFNFVILFAISYFLLYSPVKKFMDGRKKYFEDMDKEASDKLKEAEEVKASYEKKLNEAEEEAKAIKAKATEDAGKKYSEIIESANSDAEKIVSDAKKEAHALHDKILNDAKAQIGEIVNEFAEKVAMGEASQEMYDSFLNAAKKDSDNE